MLRMVVIDDERIIRDGLVNGIEWNLQNIRIVGCAADGFEGEELIVRAKPDIVISDIKMPRCDGLEMLRRIGVQRTEMKVILLTGFEEFEYARAAVGLKVDRFLLKPVDDDELRKSVQELSAELLAERMKVAVHSRDLMRQAFHLATNASAEPQLDPGTEKLLKELRASHTMDAVEAWNALVMSCGGMTIDGVRLVILRALQQALAQHVAFHPEEHKPWTDSFHAMGTAVLSAESTDGILEAGEQFLRMLLKAREGYNQPPSSGLLLRAEEYIKEHYRNSALSLREVADAVFISSSYLSALFRRKKNISFSAYLANIRIDKAKALLRNTALHSAEIAARVGYSNPQYFTLAFKRHTGLSPIQYKNSGRDYRGFE